MDCAGLWSLTGSRSGDRCGFPSLCHLFWLAAAGAAGKAGAWPSWSQQLRSALHSPIPTPPARAVGTVVRTPVTLGLWRGNGLRGQQCISHQEESFRNPWKEQMGRDHSLKTMGSWTPEHSVLLLQEACRLKIP